jgi:chromosome segregation ATPase
LKKVKELEAKNEIRIHQSQVEEAFVYPQETVNFNEKVDQLEAQVDTLQYEKRLLEDQASQLPTNEGLAPLQTTICQLETQVQSLQYEKTMLEDQISQLPSIDAFKSLQIVNEDITSKVENLLSSNEDLSLSKVKHDEDMVHNTEMIKEHKLAVSQLKKVMHDKTIEMSDTLFLAQQQTIDLANVNEEVQRLCEVIGRKDANINQLSALLEESSVHAQQELDAKIEEQTQTLLMQSQATQCLENEISSLRGQLSEHANSLLTHDHDLVEHQQTNDQRMETIEALNSKIEVLEDACTRLQNQLNSGATEMSENVGKLTSDLQDRESEIQCKINENDILKQTISALLDELKASKILLSCSSNEKMEYEAMQASLNEKSKQEWDKETKQFTEKLAAFNEKIDQLEAQVENLQYEKRLLEDQASQLPTSDGLAVLQGNIYQLEAQVQDLQYEKTMLEDQIIQLPSIDAFKSLQSVIDQLTSESAKLQFQQGQWPSTDDYKSVVAANEESSIGESQIESYETRVTELSNQIFQLTEEMGSLQASCDDASQDLQVKAEAIALLEDDKSALQRRLEEKDAISRIATTSDMEPVNEPGPVLQSEQDIDNPFLMAPAQTVEKGLSASSYFDQFGSADNVLALTPTSESAKLLAQQGQWPSTDDYNSVVAANKELSMKLTSIGESQIESYEIRVTELSNQIFQLIEEMGSLQASCDAASQDLQVKAQAIALLEDDKSALQKRLEEKDAIPRISTTSETKPVDEPAPFLQSEQDTDNPFLMAPAQTTVEKGLSSSSYFDQFGSAPNNLGLTTTDAADTSSVFETIGLQSSEAQLVDHSQQDSQLEWYKAQLEQYQQAITDWQTWSETQILEVATLQEAVAYYTNVYNTLVVKHDNCSQQQQQHKGASDEVTSLRAAVKAKEIEVEDLTETVDRLQAEKSDLEQEITDLTMTNQDLKSERDEQPLSGEQIDITLYEEARQSLEENVAKLEKVTEDLAVKNNEILEMKRQKEHSEEHMQKLQNDLTVLKNQLEEVKEEKTKTVDDLSKSNNDISTELAQLKDDLSSSQEMLDEIKRDLAIKESEIVQLKQEERLPQEKQATSTDRAEDIEQLKAEVEQQKTVLIDWGIWAQHKTEEYNTLLEAYNHNPYNQYAEAHNILYEEVSTLKEANSGLTEKLGDLEFSLETKETELSQVNERLSALEFSQETKETELSQVNEKLSALEFILETKETELSQKNSEIEALCLAEARVQQHQQQQQQQAVLSAFDVDTSKGWGGMEEDVLQGEASAPLDNAVLELEAEISDLKQKVRTEQEEKAKLNDDLTAAKIKHGKLTMKVKQLTKDLHARKSSSPASTATGGDDSLDKAIQDELNERAKVAEKSCKEAKQQVNDLTAEKAKFLDRLDTLEAGNERFMEMKEVQDREMQHLKTLQMDMQNKVGGYEWQLSEKEEQLSDLEQQLNMMTEQLQSSGNEAGAEQVNLKIEVSTLRRSLAEMESNCVLLRRQVDEMETALQVVRAEKEDLSSQLVDSEDRLDSVQEEYELLQNVQAQYESLKLRLEHLESEKQSGGGGGGGGGTPMHDYEHFQALNQNMQQEIQSLRSYIDDQQGINVDLQRRLHESDSSDPDQLQASLLFERNRISQLQKDLQNKDSTLQNVMRELGTSRSLSSRDQSPAPTSPSFPRERHESLMSADRDSEIRKIFTEPDTELTMQNERLKYDLDKSVGERRMLSQQMENWKRQLTDHGEDGDEEEEIDYEDTAFIRMKQEQAYRSVGALQLRVEELTLEVTKV